jgi:Outer membrane protein beta-barrel domain
MGIALTPCFSFRVLIGSDLVTASIARERGRLAYQGHFFTQYDFNPKLSLQVGLGYALTGYSGTKTKYIFGMPEPAAPEYGKFLYSHQDIIIPLLLRYHLGTKQNRFYITWGLIPNVKILRYRIFKAWYDDGRIEKTRIKDDSDLYLSANLSGAIGFGYDFILGKALHGFIQPIFDYNLFSITKSTLVKRRIYTIGFSMGVVLH